MAEDTAETDGEYDPTDPTPPAREPPHRSTAPQSEYTTGQIAFGLVVFFVGVAIVFGLPAVLV